MGQRLILFSMLPSGDYLGDLVAKGVLRAAMRFLPGSCYAGAGLYPETTMYSSTAPAGVGTPSACPYPQDPIACEEWEVEDALNKASFGVPQPFNAFAFLRVSPGYSEQWARDAEQVLCGMQQEAGLTPSTDYFATAHLIGGRRFNALLEYLSTDHQRLQRAIRLVTDKRYVEEVVVGNVAATDAWGWGTSGAGSVQTG